MAMRWQGMKPIMMKIARRYKAAADTGEFFAMHEWNFDVSNVNELIMEVGKAEDSNAFNCDVRTLDWDTYLKNYVFGIRKNILKDDLSSMVNARRTVKRYVIRYFLVHINYKFSHYFRLYIMKWTFQIIFFAIIIFSLYFMAFGSIGF